MNEMLTVEELINKLQKFKPKTKIIFYKEDENTPMELEVISNVEAEIMRDQNSCAKLKFGKSASSENIVLITLTSDI